MNDILLLSLLLVLSGLFSGSETALVSLSVARAEALVKEGRPGAHALLTLKRDPSRMLITILIGNNLVNIAASAMATVLATRWFGHLGPGIAVGVLTVVILIFGEITPKSLATHHAERLSLLISPLMLMLMRAIAPAVWLFAQFTSWVHRHAGSGKEPTVTESELLSLLSHGVAEGTIDSDEQALIERVFAFDHLRVKDVMTPRTRLFALDGAHTVRELLPDVLSGTYTRIPVYQHHRDDIRKMVYLRDILEAVATHNGELRLDSIAHEPLFVPENQHIQDVFQTLRKERRHIAVVVDELGTVQGVVTLEDLLEELVGEIYDESDQAAQELRELKGHQVAVDGFAELRVIEHYFAVDLPGKPTDTVNHWILNHTQRIPAVGERFVLDEVEVEVAKASPRSIQRVLLRPAPRAGA